MISGARPWSEGWATPVRGWRSEKPDACVPAMAGACPGPPHRDCPHHLLRAVAPPVLDMDRRAQGKRRRTVRGWRALARRGLAARRPAAAPAPTPADARPKTAAPPCAWSALGGSATERALAAPGRGTPGDARGADAAGEVVREDWAAVRGMLHESQGGPLHPPCIRRREA